MSPRRRLGRLFGERDSLRARSLAAFGWTMGGTLMQRGLSLISNLVMTRLLAPEAFGLMAMVITVQMMVEMMSDIGIQQSIVRSPRGGDLHYLRAAWAVQVARSSVIALIVAGAGLLIGLLGPRLAPADSVYGDPQLPWLVIVSTLTILMRGLESTAMALAARRLALRKVTMIETGSQVVTILAMILLAQIHASVWVLLGGLLLGSLQRLVWTHLAFPGTRMRWLWDAEIATEMWRFGRWMVLSSMAGFLVNNGDRLLFAALLDKTTFGIYTIALLLMDAGQQLLMKATGRVMFSGLAETMRERRAQLPTVFRKMERALELTVWTGFLAGFLLGPTVVGLLYTPQYQAAGWMLALLSFRFLARRQSLLGSLLLADGRSKLLAATIVLSAVTLLVALPLCYHLFGLPAAIAAVALSPLVGGIFMVSAAWRRFPDISLRANLLHLAIAPLLAALVLSLELYR